MDNNYVDHIVAGTIDFSTVGSCKIEIYGKEGPIPHFHIINKSNDFECCICIYSANYFTHGSKTDNKLSSIELKELDTWLRQPNKYFKPLTNWDTICVYWKTSENHMVLTPNNQPHYEDTVNTIQDTK